MAKVGNAVGKPGVVALAEQVCAIRAQQSITPFTDAADWIERVEEFLDSI
jgi:hypothetical protein